MALCATFDIAATSARVTRAEAFRAEVDQRGPVWGFDLTVWMRGRSSRYVFLVRRPIDLIHELISQFGFTVHDSQHLLDLAMSSLN